MLHEHSDKCPICRILKSHNKRAFSDKLDLDKFKVPFVYKDDAIYLGGKKIADIKEDEDRDKVVVFTNKKFSCDFVDDYFFEGLDKKKLKPGTHEIEVPITVTDFKTTSDSYTDPSGKEVSYLLAEDYKIYFCDSDIEITKLLDKKELEKIHNHVEEHVNEGHVPRYLGTHRTHP